MTGTLDTFVGTKRGTATISTSAVAISASAFGFSSTEINAAQSAIVSCINNPVMLSYDGVAVTAADGTPLAPNAVVEVLGAINIRNLQFIRQGGTDGIVTIVLES